MAESQGAYLDASALVKLVRREVETEALARSLHGWPRRASSELAYAEVIRAARREGAALARNAAEILAGLDLYAVDRRVLRRAAELEPTALRTLDAIHVATALLLGPLIGIVYVYDRRLSEAGRAAGLNVEAPA